MSVWIYLGRLNEARELAEVMGWLIVDGLCRWTIGLTFAASAVGKAVALSHFIDSLERLGVPGRRVRTVLAGVIVGCEAFIAVMSGVGGGLVCGAFTCSIVLLVVFSATLLRVLQRGVRTSCNCFGRSARPVTKYDVLRNAILIGASILGLWAQGVATGQIVGLAALQAGLMGAVFSTVVAHLGDILQVLRRSYVVE